MKDVQILTAVYFSGNAPALAGLGVFDGDTNATINFLPETTGWTSAFFDEPTILWNPQVQTKDGNFGVQRNQFGFDITGPTNLALVVEVGTNPAKPAWSALESITLTNGSYFSLNHYKPWNHVFSVCVPLDWAEK